MKKISIISVSLFLGVVFLAGCSVGQQGVNEARKDLIEKREIIEETVQEVSPEEFIDFENPGNDEIGKKVEQIDSLINSTSTSEYENDLSGEILAEQE
jgi:PBP1b-binding outer membrane lipoprotein LpoB